jgi:hypothetical protein
MRNFEDKPHKPRFYKGFILFTIPCKMCFCVYKNIRLRLAMKVCDATPDLNEVS